MCRTTCITLNEFRLTLTRCKGAQSLSAWSFDSSNVLGGGAGGNDGALSPLVKSLQGRLERAEDQYASHPL